MKISGFTFIRNGSKLYYPIIESILSAMPLVDEFVIALGDSDPDDTTEADIKALNNPKIKIVKTVWDLEKYPQGMEHAHQTDIAKDNCTGDWLIYLQGDEVIHEEDIPKVRANCEKYLNDKEVDGMLFDYLHFWGDYNHAHNSHAWYKQEIRLVRNDPVIHSFKSAQSFRKIPNFDGVSYRNKEGTEKLRCIHSGARMFHYGWVRPPEKMKLKSVYINRNHHGDKRAEEIRTEQPPRFDYGPLHAIPKFTDTHPAVMEEKIKTLNWQDELYDHPKDGVPYPVHAHAELRNRIISWIENTLFGGKHLFSSRNYVLLKRK